MLGWPRTPSPSQYEMPSPLSLLCPALRKDAFRLSLRAETLEFVAQPVKQMAQTTRTLLKRTVDAFQCMLFDNFPIESVHILNEFSKDSRITECPTQKSPVTAP